MPASYTDVDVRAAIEALPDAGGIVALGPVTYSFADVVHVPRNVHVQGAATVIEHSGDGLAFDLADDGFDLTARRSVSGMWIKGSPGSGAAAVELSNGWGHALRDVLITGYTTGKGLRIRNTDGWWTEGVNLENVQIRECGTCLEVVREGGTDSFGYQKWRNVSLQVSAGCVGVDFGGEGGEDVYLYNSDLEINFWLEGAGATAIVVRPGANVSGNRYQITGEGSGHPGMVGIRNLGGVFRGYGAAAIAGVDNDLNAGATHVLPYPEPLDGVSGKTATEHFAAALASNPDVQHNAQFGFVGGNNIEVAYAAGFQGSSEVFRVLAVPYGGRPSTASKVFAIRPDGRVVLNSGAQVMSGPGSPSGAVAAPRGTLYLRTGGSGAALFVKESGTGTGGWVAK